MLKVAQWAPEIISVKNNLHRNLPIKEWGVTGRLVTYFKAFEPAYPSKFYHIAANARHRLRARMALISVFSGDYAHVVAATGGDKGFYQASTLVGEYAMLSPGKLFVVPDVLRDDRFATYTLSHHSSEIRFCAAVALLMNDGPPIGALCVIDTKARLSLSVDEALALRSLADASMKSLADFRS